MSILLANDEDLVTLTGQGPTNLNGWWDGIALEREAVALAGEDFTEPVLSARGTARIWPLELLISAATPAAGLAKLDALKRLLPVGQLAKFQLDDADRVAWGMIESIGPVRVFEATNSNWDHGDRLVTINVRFYDPALYSEDETVEALSAATPKKIDLGTLPSRFVFEADGAFTGITLIAYEDDGTGLAPGAEYARIQLDTDVASGGTLIIDGENQVPIYDDGVSPVNVWDDIIAGWFFKLGTGKGETHIWLESNRAGSATYTERWG